MSITTRAFSASGSEVMKEANASAMQMHFPAISAANLLIAILNSNTLGRQIVARNIDPKILVEKLTNSLKDKARTGTIDTVKMLPIEQEVGKIVQLAEEEALRENVQVDSQHLLFGLLGIHNSVSVYLSFYGIVLSRAKMIYEELLKQKATMKSSTETVKTDSAKKDSCGSGCGCPVTGRGADIANQAANDHARVSTATPSSNTSRDEWVQILDIALKLNETSGLSVPAAFIHVSIANSAVFSKEIASQVRRSTLNDVVESVLKIQ